MTDNRSLEKKLLALSKGEKVVFTDEEKQQLGNLEEITAEPGLNEEAEEAKAS